MTAGPPGREWASFPANGVPAIRAGFSALGLVVTVAGDLQVSDLGANKILEIGG